MASTTFGCLVSFFATVGVTMASVVSFKAGAQPVEALQRERGKLIASGGGSGGRGDACFTCHGAHGDGQAASAFPRLAGLPIEYQAKQLDDYASGARIDPLMSPIAKRLSQADRHAVSSHFARLSGKPSVKIDLDYDPRVLQRGAKLHAQGSAERGVQACANCHGPQGTGLASSFPPLAGQHASYIAEQFRRWRMGERNNSVGGVMEFIAKQMPATDVNAVATYLARLKPQLETRRRR